MLWEKEKLLVLSNFSFSNRVFKRLVLQRCKNTGLREFADDNYKFNENGEKFSKKVKNVVEKGEIACFEQFLHFPLSFQKTCTT